MADRKKTVLLTCAVLLAGALSVTAMAEDPEKAEFPAAGITLNFTPEYLEAKGTIVPYGGNEIGGGAGIYETDLIYVALDQEESDNLEEAILESGYASLISIISLDNDMTLDDLNEFAGGGLDPDMFHPICTVEGCTHYYLDDPEAALPEGTDAVYLEEFEELKNGVDELLANSEFGKPVDPTEGLIGSKIAFETTDIEGNPIKSEDLFGANEITMVNIWASWCEPCKGELAELEAINGRLAEKDCAVVGLLTDGNEEEGLAAGREILEEKGVTYTNILPPENLDDLFYFTAIPTTYFVNREGIIVGTPIVGASVDEYEPAVEALLSGNEPAAEELSAESAMEEETETEAVETTAEAAGSTAEASEDGSLAARIETNDDSVYRVIVTDEDGNPIPEVTVQFCSDTTCKMGETDETGTAVFQDEKGHYTVHVLEAPEEYAENEAEYTLEEYSDLTIILTKA